MSCPKTLFQPNDERSQQADRRQSILGKWPNRIINNTSSLISYSQLLSLKAELLRKHQEVNKTKLSQQNQIPAPAVASAQNKSKKSTQSKRNKETKTASDAPKTTVLADTYAEAEMLQKSKRVLEAKSKFYDRMSRAGGSLNSDENCLVMFNRKKQQTEGPRGRYETSSSSSSASSDEDAAEDGDWVEYTDCLGRTRKCLKEDLASVKERDKELAKTVGTPTPVPEHTFVSVHQIIPCRLHRLTSGFTIRSNQQQHPPTDGTSTIAANRRCWPVPDIRLRPAMTTTMTVRTPRPTAMTRRV